MKKENIYPLICLIFLVFLIAFSIIKPIHMTSWMLENVPFIVAIFFLILIFLYKKLRLSNTAYTLTLLFIAFHLVGVFFGWQNVPFTKPLMEIFNLSTNPYDAIVHFLSGLLLYYPVLEVYLKLSKTKEKIWFTYLMPAIILIAFGAIYEVYEWICAVNVNADLAASFLGTGGDIWDAQSDLLCNTLGGFTSGIFFYLRNKFQKKEK
ncbi:DUF2238 domain-containing protein [Candidatus Pacearchaeota archaeon]|nr:DUF2238 domain-containing protein [Candidatus Pacearchaeota archaeon]